MKHRISGGMRAAVAASAGGSRLGVLLALISGAFACWIHWSLQYPLDWSAHWSADDESTDDHSIHRARLAHGAKFAQGKFGRAASLDGIKSTVVLDGWETTPDCTLAGWVYPTATQPGIRLIAGTPSLASSFGIVTSNGYFGALIGSTNGIPIILISRILAETNRWFQIVLTRNVAASRIYVDGAVCAEGPAPPRSAGVGIHLGNWHGPPQDSGFAGLIDEVFLFSRALSHAEVKSLHRSSHWSPGARWHLSVVFGSLSGAFVLTTLILHLAGVFRRAQTLSETGRRSEIRLWSWGSSVTGVLLIGLTGSGCLFAFLQRDLDRRVRERFRSQIDDFLDRFDSRTEQHVQMLNSLRARFAGDKNVDLQKWHEMVADLEFPADYPGLYAIGFAPLIRPENVREFQEWARTAVIPTFEIHPQIPEAERVLLCQVFEDCAAARFPVTFQSYGFAQDKRENLEATDWGRDLLGLKQADLNSDNPIQNTLEHAFTSGNVCATLPGVLEPAYRGREAVVGTMVFFSVNKAVGIAQPDAGLTKSKSATFRFPGILFSLIDWQQFFHSAMKGRQLEVGFTMSGPTFTERVLLARADKIDFTSTPLPQDCGLPTNRGFMAGDFSLISTPPRLFTAISTDSGPGLSAAERQR